MCREFPNRINVVLFKKKRINVVLFKKRGSMWFLKKRGLIWSFKRINLVLKEEDQCGLLKRRVIAIVK